MSALSMEGNKSLGQGENQLLGSKPIVTYAGNSKLFESLEKHIIDGLPQTSSEWRRSQGRPTRKVQLSAVFEPFNEGKLAHSATQRLTKRQYLHTYWTDCNEVDAYKSTVRSDIISWTSKLKMANAYDWMIVVVEPNTGTSVHKTSKLLRTTVWDKIKSDFQSKNLERCVCLVDPFKADPRAVTSSLQQFLEHLRGLLLHAYNREMSLYEEIVRKRRERRNETGWSFVDFFFLQEEMAFVLEMLGLNDEALVQYDELDALLTQFIINANVKGETPPWLSRLASSTQTWYSFCLLPHRMWQLREVLVQNGGSLLDLRNYLFTRVCWLLLKMREPWEMAKRSLPYFHNAIHEVSRLLEVAFMDGATACWLFVGCMETLREMERHKEQADHGHAYNLCTAELSSSARQQLTKLGHFCGLMPPNTPTSEHLHHVVNLLAGLGSDPYLEIADAGRKLRSPQDRLSEALSSKESFVRHYLEMSELSMGTFKHIGRLRCARLIGKDLAEFYMNNGAHQKAVQFLQDMLKLYTREQWMPLVADVQRRLIECYEVSGYEHSCVQSCLQIITNPALSSDERLEYFKKFKTLLDKIDERNDPKVCSLEMGDIFIVRDIALEWKDKVLSRHTLIKLHLKMTSQLFESIRAKEITVSVTSASGATTKANQTPNAVWDPKRAIRPSPVLAVSTGFQPELNDNTVQVTCTNIHQVLTRQDSHSWASGGLNDVQVHASQANFSARDVLIEPGDNELVLEMTAQSSGSYTLHQLRVDWRSVCFVHPSPLVVPPIQFEVVEEPFRIQLDLPPGELLTGVPQTIVVDLIAGSDAMSEGDSTVHITTSVGLVIQSVDGVVPRKTPSGYSVGVEPIPLFSQRPLTLVCVADFKCQTNASVVSHDIMVTPSWTSKRCEARIHMLPPFMSVHKLKTCDTRKFVQIDITGLTASNFYLRNHRLVCNTIGNVILVPVNGEKDAHLANTERAVHYLWELKVSQQSGASPLSMMFTVEYATDLDSQTSYTYEYSFKLQNYESMFWVRTSVEPLNHAHCKVDVPATLYISVGHYPAGAALGLPLMYEVIADSNMWSLQGKPSGIISPKQLNDDFTTTMELRPLMRGFLPLPTVRLSKCVSEHIRVTDIVDESMKLEVFSAGQVYNWSRAAQAHVPTGPDKNTLDVDS